ncbi:class I SAM-dependent methyltransferase [Candidatus Pelagibacter sp.]|nr:class I SAM-dependent methyltransferase [Candidatus Pelagibacter sp.]
MKPFNKIKKCRICNNKNLKKIVDLKKQYIQGSFIKKNKPTPYKKKIPLALLLCQKCSLVQLSHTTNKDLLYKNYWYESAINSTMRNHLKDLSKTTRMILNFGKKDNITVLDIGCNDGTLLSFYPKNFFKYGIDPSQIIKKITDKKIKKIQDFFPPITKTNQLYKIKFNLITSIAMFYDLDDPNIFVKKIKLLLKEKGIWVFELSYLVDMLKLNSFDTICHEHLEYYSLHSLNFLMNKHNLKIFKVSKNSSNGGSIRCFVTHKNNNVYNNKGDDKLLNSMMSKERIIKIKNKTVYKNFLKKIEKIKKHLLKEIFKIKKKDKTVYILGASTKGNTILQYLNITDKEIPFAIERNKEKIGANTIGSNIKIVSEDFAKNNPPDYKLVLPWHFKKEIIKREYNFLKKGGKLIFPLPSLLVINKNNLKKYV